MNGLAPVIIVPVLTADRIVKSNRWCYAGREDVVMFKDDQRVCDICDEPIVRGMTYYTGHTTQDVLGSWFRDAPDLIPLVAKEPDGTLRLEVCAECVEASEILEQYTEATVDVVH